MKCPHWQFAKQTSQTNLCLRVSLIYYTATLLFRNTNAKSNMLKNYRKEWNLLGKQWKQSWKLHPHYAQNYQRRQNLPHFFQNFHLFQVHLISTNSLLCKKMELKIHWHFSYFCYGIWNDLLCTLKIICTSNMHNAFAVTLQMWKIKKQSQKWRKMKVTQVTLNHNTNWSTQYLRKSTK